MEYKNTVLVVDDSHMVVKVVSMMLKKAGYEVLAASDGLTALKHLDGRNIDLLITDLNMPGMDGQTLINTIRISPEYKYTPVLLFVADDERDKKKYLGARGATMLFDKNNIKEKLLPTIKKLTA